MATSSYASFSGFKDKSTKKAMDTDDMSFGKAFDYYKNNTDQKTFTWRGKKYTTETKSEARKTSKMSSAKNIDPDDLKGSGRTRTQTSDTGKNILGKDVEGGRSSGMAGTPGGKSVSEEDRFKSAVDRKDSDTIGRLTKRKISKIKGMKAGGSVKSKKKAVKKFRADGIAKKGKTRCKMR